jgi:hypothetical protein
MQKGFGILVLIVVIAGLLLVGGAGFWLGRLSTESFDSGISSVLFNQNQASSSVQTSFIKRSYDPKQEIYPGYSLPAELVNAPEHTLTGFNCDGPYMQNSDGQYFWQVQFDGEVYLKPLSSELYTEMIKVNDYLRGVGTKEPAAYITYCVTETDKKYLLAGQPMLVGGGGSDTYIFDLTSGIGNASSGKITSEPWPYFGCSNILQISQESMYVFCSAGDGGFSGQAIYKKSLISGEISPAIKCINQFTEDLQSSKTSCE